MKETSLCTVSGKEFDLFERNPKDVSLHDISYSLSNLCRFNGHPKYPFSVAQHCIFVSEMLREQYDSNFALHGLLHDAHEAYIGDMTRPFVAFLEKVVNGNFKASIKTVKNLIDAVIYEHFGLELPKEEEVKIIKEADGFALNTERYVLGLCSEQRDLKKTYDVNCDLLKRMSSEEAYNIYYTLFLELTEGIR